MATLHQARAALAGRAGDDEFLPIVRDNAAGGQKTRTHPSNLQPNEFETLTNVDIGSIGERRKRNGSIEIANEIIAGATVDSLKDFKINGAADQLLAAVGRNIYKSEAEGNFSLVIDGSTYSLNTGGMGFAQGKESGLAPDDVMLISDNVANTLRLDPSGNVQDLGDANDSPPLTDVMAWHQNRFWALKNDLLYYSDAYSADYSTAWNRTTESFRVPVGQERGLFSSRDLGIIVLGQNAVWSLAPSSTPAATDQPVPLVPDIGCVAKNAWEVIGDDIFYFSTRGLESLKRNIQDKYQFGVTFPVSYELKDAFNEIDWGNIANVVMKFWDNKLFITVPTSGGNVSTWIYYPPIDAFVIIDGWSPRCYDTHKVSGEDFLYYGKISGGKVYKAWQGFRDEGTDSVTGTNISYVESDKRENFGQPFQWKSGGELEVEAFAGGGTLTIRVALDGNDFATLGTMDLSSTTELPQTLPFNLQGERVLRKIFPLETLGRFRTIQFKILESSANTADVIIYSTNITTNVDPL